MNLFVREAFSRLSALRGHIPGHDGLPERPAGSSHNESSKPLMPILAVVGAVLAALSLVVWAAVSTAIRSL